MSATSARARHPAGTGVLQPGQTHGAPGPGAEPSPAPIGRLGFFAVAISSLGGPLALAALGAPSLLGDGGASSGLAALAAAVVFTVPLAIWFGFSRHVASSGGLFAFVQAAAGRPIALLQGAIWTVSYLLYLLYTTVQIVYDLLPVALGGERSLQTPLALLIPAAVVAVMLAGRAAALIVIGAIAAGQLVLLGVLDAVTVAHLSTPASSFAAGAPTGSLARAGAQGSLLYICASLPLFLGGELTRPARTIRRGLSAAFALSAAGVILAVAPLAGSPGLLRTAIPGMTVVQEFAGGGWGQAIGLGVAASTAGVMLCEYLALTRLLTHVRGWPARRVTLGIGVVMVAAAPASLVDPEGFYTALLKPSLVALWLSQLIVFAVFPAFARRRRRPLLPALALSLPASALALYGVWTALQQATT